MSAFSVKCLILIAFNINLQLPYRSHKRVSPTPSAPHLVNPAQTMTDGCRHGQLLLGADTQRQVPRTGCCFRRSQMFTDGSTGDAASTAIMVVLVQPHRALTQCSQNVDIFGPHPCRSSHN